jgi:hypothetical protein
LDFSLDLRKGSVGGESGFDAARAFRNCDAAMSALEGENKKTMITTHNTTPTMMVNGFVRRSDRTGPMMKGVVAGCGVFDDGTRITSGNPNHAAQEGV